MLVLTTAAHMPKADVETRLLADALRRRGVAVQIRPWDAPVDWSKVDLVVVRTTWDYFERLDEFLRWADEVEATTRLVNRAGILAWNGHKQYLVELAAAGVPTVPTVLVRQGTPTPDLDAIFGGPDELVVKPAVSAGAIGALRADPSEATDHVTRLLSGGDVLVQPLVPSVLTEGETSLIFFADEFSHAVRKIAMPGEYRVQEHYGGTVQPHHPGPEELAVARAAIDAAPGATTYARVDLVATPTGPVVMELELIEPALFFEVEPEAAHRFASVLQSVLEGG